MRISVWSSDVCSSDLGGCSGSGCTPVERSAELVHIETGRSEVTQPMNDARVAHAAAIIKDGRGLVAGGWTGDMATDSAEVFDLQHSSLSPVQAMAKAIMADTTAEERNVGTGGVRTF